MLGLHEAGHEASGRAPERRQHQPPLRDRTDQPPSRQHPPRGAAGYAPGRTARGGILQRATTRGEDAHPASSRPRGGCAPAKRMGVLCLGQPGEAQGRAQPQRCGYSRRVPRREDGGREGDRADSEAEDGDPHGDAGRGSREVLGVPDFNSELPGAQGPRRCEAALHPAGLGGRPLGRHQDQSVDVDKEEIYRTNEARTRKRRASTLFQGLTDLKIQDSFPPPAKSPRNSFSFKAAIEPVPRNIFESISFAEIPGNTGSPDDSTNRCEKNVVAYDPFSRKKSRITPPSTIFRP